MKEVKRKKDKKEIEDIRTVDTERVYNSGIVSYHWSFRVLRDTNWFPAYEACR